MDECRVPVQVCGNKEPIEVCVKKCKKAKTCCREKVIKLLEILLSLFVGALIGALLSLIPGVSVIVAIVAGALALLVLLPLIIQLMLKQCDKKDNCCC
ncbi:MAG: hypothetical protein LBL91_04890 [Lachnospiraceae bacterium]|jgi:uncharacterized membrane protein YoaK (UPF0700 family)|nr:hypothetical protein [Lachnospiraceae bacterium]